MLFSEWDSPPREPGSDHPTGAELWAKDSTAESYKIIRIDVLICFNLQECWDRTHATAKYQHKQTEDHNVFPHTTSTTRITSSESRIPKP